MEFSKEKTKYEVKFTSAMKKDMKKVEKRHYDLSLFAEIVGKLANGLPLDEKYCDHALEGNWKNHRECHIKPDWLLVYQAQFRVLNFSVIIGLDPIIHWKDC
ncbi:MULTISPECIES: type II toxin-antitoxin system YafQ family toxin [unclassified Treponema]|uniref:type II toxin-antitoxin system YafQ family toxin n=2 Tax=Treponema TaxID=157 RepID=UPI0025F7B013|nr:MULTISPECIES: type II toxin-antitoxin system YafQ family toxin [unclassified Treponema]